jgi:uncharacterized protein DUF6054
MQSIVIQGELSAQDLQSALDASGVEREAAAAYAFGEVRVIVLVGQKYFMRTNTRVGVAVVAATDGKTQRIDIAQAGGAQGLFGVEWGAGDSIEAGVYNEIGALAQQRGLPINP